MRAKDMKPILFYLPSMPCDDLFHWDHWDRVSVCNCTQRMTGGAKGACSALRISGKPGKSLKMPCCLLSYLIELLIKRSRVQIPATPTYTVGKLLVLKL